MNTEFENMALLNIEDYNELKAKAEATDEQIKKQAEEMAKPEVVTLKVCFDTYGLLYRPNTCVDVEIRGQDKTGACVQHRPLHDFREIY